MTLAGSAPVPPPPAFVERADAPALLAVAGPAWPADAERPLPPAAMVLFDAKGGGLHLGPLGDAAGDRGAQPAGGEAVGGAGAGAGGPAGAEPAAGECRPDGALLPLDDASLASAKALAPQINPLVPPAGPIPGNRLPASSSWGCG